MQKPQTHGDKRIWWEKKKQCISEEIKEEVRKYLETNENKHTCFQNLWDAAKAVLRGKLIATQVYLKNQGTSPIKNLTYHLKELEKEQAKPKVSYPNLTKLVCSNLLEKEALDQPIRAWLLSTSYLTWLQDFPLLHVRKVAFYLFIF